MAETPNENPPGVPGATPPDAAQPESAPGAEGDFVEDALAQAKSSLDEIQAVTETASPVGGPDAEAASGIDLLNDVDLHVMIELGRTEMLLEDVLKLNSGSVVELDKLAGDPVDVYVNNRLIARGEVLVLNDNFCIRISEIVDTLEDQAEQDVEQQLSAAG